jgi:hypothetical protein
MAEEQGNPGNVQQTHVQESYNPRPIVVTITDLQRSFNSGPIAQAVQQVGPSVTAPAAPVPAPPAASSGGKS